MFSGVLKENSGINENQKTYPDYFQGINKVKENCWYSNENEFIIKVSQPQGLQFFCLLLYK